mmetsp:Transcript_13813/g.55517  ORF Transcript_13813/g.55517 Transcript_13813/m.55517 type:complete len:144 (+) Transcript_13813:6427-6858(+)
MTFPAGHALMAFNHASSTAQGALTPPNYVTPPFRRNMYLGSEVALQAQGLWVEVFHLVRFNHVKSAFRKVGCRLEQECLASEYSRHPFSLEYHGSKGTHSRTRVGVEVSIFLRSPRSPLLTGWMSIGARKLVEEIFPAAAFSE